LIKPPKIIIPTLIKITLNKEIEDLKFKIKNNIVVKTRYVNINPINFNVFINRIVMIHLKVYLLKK